MPNARVVIIQAEGKVFTAVLDLKDPVTIAMLALQG